MLSYSDNYSADQITLPGALFVTQLSQLQLLIDSINEQMKCRKWNE